jgi:choline dehydrogenase
VLTGALVTRITFARKKATGVELFYQGQTRHIAAASEIVLSLGAINTPKLLMQSGIGDSGELGQFDIPVVEHLPGVGKNLQDHPSFGRIWQSSESTLPSTALAEAVVFSSSRPALQTPDFAIFPIVFPFTSPENQEKFRPPSNSWALSSILLHPKSRGEVRLTGSNPLDPLRIEARYLSDADDMKAALASVEGGVSIPIRARARGEAGVFRSGNARACAKAPDDRRAFRSHPRRRCPA